MDQESWVWLKFIRNKNTHKRINHNHYHFRVFGGISLGKVRPEDVGAALALRVGCCGSPKRPAFSRAAADQVARWKAAKVKVMVK